MFTLVLIALLPAQIASNIWPDFGKDATGDFVHAQDKNKKPTSYFKIAVIEVIDDNTMVCKLGDKPAFLVTKYKHGTVDDAKVELKGKWKCTGTKKQSGKTMWVVEPLKE